MRNLLPCRPSSRVDAHTHRERRADLPQLRLGDLVSLHMLDTRAIGRDKQLTMLISFTTSAGIDRRVSPRPWPIRRVSCQGRPRHSGCSSRWRPPRATWQVLANRRWDGGA